jgi:hypothetical protein
MPWHSHHHMTVPYYQSFSSKKYHISGIKTPVWQLWWCFKFGSLCCNFFVEVVGKGSFAKKGMLTIPCMLCTLGWKGLSVTATTGRS